MRSPEIRPGIRRLFRLAVRKTDRARDEADDEIRLHLTLRAEQLVEQGWPLESARAEAERRFGPIDEARASVQDSARQRESRLRADELWNELRQDLRFAWRGIRRAPGFAAIVVATLAIGIGAATAIFSVIHGVLLRPLPYADADRVVALHSRFPALGIERGLVSYPELTDLAALGAFERVGAHAAGDLTVTGGGEPERLRALFASAELFRVLRTPPLVGRVFTDEEDRPGAEGVVVLSHGYWQRRFGGDAGVVGRRLVADGAPRTITGVMPAHFDFGDAELYLPLAIDPAGGFAARAAHNFQGVARLAPGVTFEQAAAQLAALTTRIRADHPDVYPPGMQFTLFALTLRDALVGDVRPALRLLAGVVALVLLIACANAANLLLVRGESRQRELGVHAALGAGRGRIVRQLLTESALLSVLAGVLGLVLAGWGVRALLAVNPDALPRHQFVRLDFLVAGVALLLSLVTGLLFGAAPALQGSRADLQTLLRGGGRGSTAGRSRLRRSLVVGEFALAVVVVVSAGLLLRSFWTLRRVDSGLDPRGVLTLATSLPESRYPQPRVAQTYEELLARIDALPGVERAGAVALLPLAVTGWNWDVVVEGKVPAPGAPAPSPRPQVVTPGALEAMGATVKRGRPILSSDDVGAPPVALVNEAMARALWPGGDALGKRFRRDGQVKEWTTVVGVVRDVRSDALRDPAAPEFYVPLAQFRRFAGWMMRDLTLVIRTPGDPSPLAAPVRRALAAFDPDLAVADVRTLREVIERSVAQPRFVMLLLSAFGVVALVLAAVGVYGVISFGVAQRAREFGIRTALGARRGDVLRLVLRQGVGLGALGVALGVGGALVATRALRGLVFGVSVTDPWTFIAIPLLLLAVAALASVVPARRATRTDQTEALRGE